MNNDEALNTLAKMFHSGEEIEGPDGLAMMVDMSLWNDAVEALEELIGGDGEAIDAAIAAEGEKE